MQEVLSDLARRMPRVVREHEVLRITGRILGDHPDTVAKSAIDEVLKWVQRRCGGQLPADAWNHLSFEYLSGGRNSNCVHLTDGADIWAIRTDDPDKTVASRNWTTEIVVGLLPNQPPRFSSRLLVSTPESDPQIEPHTPGFVQQVVKTCQLACGNQHLSVKPWVFETTEDADELIEHLVDPERHLPIFAVTLAEGGRSDHPTLNTTDLGRAVLGIAHVALIHPAATWRLTNRFGQFRSVFGGAARVYLRGFAEDADPYSHRLVLADQIATPEGAARCTSWFRQLAAEQSVRRTKLGHDVLSFAEIRNVTLKLRQQTLRKEKFSESEQLTIANDRITALEKEIEQQKLEQEYYLDEYEKERKRAEAAESQAQNSSARIQSLTKKLKAKGDDPDADIALPETWAALCDWCDKHLTGRLVLTPNARRGAKNPDYRDVETAARCLLWLAVDSRDMRIDGGSGSINNKMIMDGIQNASCGSDTYDFDWNGRRLSADWHIKNGGNTRDPLRCLRIYYCFDEQTQQIIVSDLPAHRRTGAS